MTEKAIKKSAAAEKRLSTAYGEPDEVQEVLAHMPTPPDGGYGWVITFVAFLSNFVVDGICSSMGIVKSAFGEKFGVSETLCNLIGSLLIGSYLLAGPFVAGLVDKYGARFVVMTGGIISAFAFFISSFVGNYWLFLTVFSIFGGIGFGFIYLPSIVMVGYYFESKRALATSLAVAGSGVGGIFLPVLINKVYSFAELNGTIIFLAILNASIIIFGMLYRDLVIKDFDPEEKLGCISTAIWKICGYRPAREGQQTPEIGPDGDGRFGFEAAPLIDSKEEGRKRTDTISSMGSHKNLNKIKALSLGQSLNKLHHDGLSLTGSQLSVAISQAEAKELNKPMSRQDIFLQGSIQNLKEFKDEGKDFKNYRASQMSINTAALGEDLKEAIEAESKIGGAHSASVATLNKVLDEIGLTEDKSACKCIPLSVRNMFHSMIDVELLLQPTMMLIALSNLIAMLAFYIPYFFIKDFGVSKGLSAADGALIVSIMNITNTIGRVFCGWLADRNWISALNLTNLSLISAAALMCLVPTVCVDYITNVGLWAVYGFCSAPFICLTSIVLADHLGVEKLSNSFGLLVVARGIACILGTPVAGFFYDLTKDYSVCFYIGGAFFFFAGLVSIGILFVQKKPESDKVSLNGKKIIKEETTEL
uniref:MFS domain-containing protein n=1 Tax=Rhabditophanes sp. KR3021 TaxID=114890 RepID=A0AC35TIN0_9BILA